MEGTVRGSRPQYPSGERSKKVDKEETFDQGDEDGEEVNAKTQRRQIKQSGHFPASGVAAGRLDRSRTPVPVFSLDGLREEPGSRGR